MKRFKNWICPKCNLQFSGRTNKCSKCGYNPTEKIMKEFNKFVSKKKLSGIIIIPNLKKRKTKNTKVKNEI